MPSEVLKALSDPTRIKIVQALSGKEICACEFVNITSRAQPTVSKQLGILENAGVLKSRRDGKRILYSLSDDRAVTIIDLAEQVKKAKVN
jgi:DNA-binding transcriptional ArsR family regulator